MNSGASIGSDLFSFCKDQSYLAVTDTEGCVKEWDGDLGGAGAAVQVVTSFTSTNVKLRLRFDVHLTFT